MALTKRKLQELINEQSKQREKSNREDIINSLHEEQVKSGKFKEALNTNQATGAALQGARKFDNSITANATLAKSNTGINAGVANAPTTTVQNTQHTSGAAQNTTGTVAQTPTTTLSSPTFKRKQLVADRSGQNENGIVYPEIKQKSGLSYIQKRGQESFANAMENINATGTAMLPAVKAFANTLVNSGNRYDTDVEYWKKAFEAAKNAYNNSMEEQYKEKADLQKKYGKETDYADTDPAYKKARSKTFTKVVGDLNSSMANMLPSIMMAYSGSAVSPLVSSVLSAGTTYANSSPEAYREARSEGATPKQASTYATLEGANQAASDMLIGGVAGVGEGIVDKAVSKYAGNALNSFFRSRPMLKAVADTAAKSAGEGFEEMVQSLITTGNKKLIYDPDAKIDVAGLAYEGALGALMGAAYGIPALPGKYYVYKADYDTVNNFARAASQVKDFDSAQKLEVIMDNVVRNTEETIKDMKTQKQTDDVKEDISRLEYIKDEVKKTKDEFSSNMADIVNQNINQNDALEKVLDSKPDDLMDNIANLVDVVSEGAEPDSNAINDTIDYVQQEIQNKEAEYLASSLPEDKRKAEIDQEALKKTDEILRNSRQYLEDLIADYRELGRQKSEEAAERNKEIEEGQAKIHEQLVSIFEGDKDATTQATPDNASTVTTEKPSENIEKENQPEVLQNNSKSGTIEPKQEEAKAPKEFQLHHIVHTNTKTGEKQDVFKIKGSLSNKEYERLKKLMGGADGYYSRYVGGFIVKNPEAVNEFADTDYVKPTESTSEPKIVEKVDAADSPINTSDATDNTAGDTNNTTNNTEVKKEEAQKPESKKETATKETKKQSGKKLQMPPKPVYHEGKGVVQYFLPGKKTPFAVSTQATFDSIEALAEEHNNTMQELYDSINYDPAAKQIVGKYIENGYGDYSPSDVFGFKNAGASETVVGKNDTDSIDHSDTKKNDKPNTTEQKADAAKKESKTEPVSESKEPSTQISDFVFDRLSSTKTLSMKELQDAANKAYGGTMAEGAYDVKAMTDAMELGVNRHIIDLVSKNQADFNSNNPNDAVDSIHEINDDILALIPTQTKRSEEQISLQQFSTPPNIAYLASWVANINGADVVLEPSAGIGGLASFAKADGAKVIVNELSDSRLAMLKQLPFDGFYQENAEQIDNILPDNVKPSVVLMNPPFSSTGGRTKNSTKNAIPHIEQALARLEDGGRLVAIVGKGMANDTPTFKGWYNELRQNYDIRANIGINGENYRKYGTTFDVQLLVIDKTGAQNGETIVGNYDNLEDIPKLLNGVRNDRNRTDKQLETRSTGEGNNDERGVSGTKKRDLADNVPVGNGITSTDTGLGDTAVQAGTVDTNERQLSGNGVVSGQEKPGNLQETNNRSGQLDGGGSDTGVRGNTEISEGVSEGERRPGVGGSGIRERMGSGERSVATDGGKSGNVSKQTDYKETTKKKETKKKVSESDDGVFASYTPAALTVQGAKKHPAKLVESSAMSAVPSPELHYKPHLDQSLIDNGALSDVQLESISYAGQAHEQILPNGQRRGFFIGDGTGVGKGRQISGIIMDNFNQGRKKAVWISKTAALFEDAKRDWADLGGNPDLLLDYSSKKVRDNLGTTGEGILFTTYSTLRGGVGGKKGKDGYISHVDALKKWLGEDFDGVIAYDEAHQMKNLTGEQGDRGKSKGSQQAEAAVKFQSELPNARVVYVSATGATEVGNLSYAQRLGLWGEGTAFASAEDFVAKIGRSGVAAMELVARDMKAMGAYLARSISWDGVQYDNIEHTLTEDQVYMYDTMSEAWQVVLQNFDKAMQLTSSANSAEVKRNRSSVYGKMQSFYNQVLTSMSMPSVIADIENELKNGHSCVIQLVNTFEQAQNNALADAREKGEVDYDNLDITPRQILLSYVEKAFPTQQYEQYIDENGKEQSRPVVDSNGNPVINKQAVKMRDELVARINDISIPEGPLDMIINHFGAENVSEVTGRKTRIINSTDEKGNVAKTKDTRNPRRDNVAAAKDFQDGKTRILVFSDAGSTGMSFHASNKAKNKQKRAHYILQPGFAADKATQSFGRTKRSDAANDPIYKLVFTNAKGQKRFATSIARRLAQLGALTSGQRETSSNIFSEKDNLESPISSEALHTFYKRLGGGLLKGLDAENILNKMGLTKNFYDEYGRFKLDETVARDIKKFLNRILVLPVDEQNRAFDAFEEIREQYYDAAIEAGTLDTGMENVKADKVTVEQDSVVRTDESTGAETKYVRATVYTKPTVIESVEDAKVYSKNFVGLRRMEDGSVRAVYRIADQTNAYGVVVKRYKLQSANTVTANTMSEKNMEAKTTVIPEKEWDSAWKEAVKEVPEYNERTVHMITGALLPIWNKLPNDGVVKAMRLTAEDGTQYLGRIIPPKQIDSVLRQLDVKGGDTKQYTGKEIYSAVMDKSQVVVFNGIYGGTMTVARRLVSGEKRLEVTGGNMFALRQKYPDLIMESIQYKNRYFIPTGAKGEAILSDMIENYKIRSVGEAEDGDVYYKRKTAEEIRNADEAIKKDKPVSLDDLKRETEKMFNIPINYGRTNGMAGMYKSKENTIRIAKAGDFLTVAHEIGHKLDNRYNFHSMPEISELKTAFYDSLAKEGYIEPQIPGELVAEYVKTYMENADYAKNEFPQFTKVFLESLDKRDSDNIARLSSMSNAYYDSETTARAQAAVHNRAQENTVAHEVVVNLQEAARDPSGFMGTKASAAWKTFMANFVDDVDILNHFGSSYNMAMRERQSGAVVRGWLKGSATNKNGEIIGPGLSDTLSMAGITPDQRLAFDSYLVDLAAYDHQEYEKKNPSGVKNAGRVYGDQRVQDTIEKRIKEVEEKYPHFANAAQAVFEYDNMLMQRAVESGIVSSKTVETWNEIYPHYSPLYRVMDDKKSNISVFKSFKGSGRDVYSPVENRILQTEKIIRSSMKNDIALAFFDYVDTHEDMGMFAEKVPPKMYKEIIGLFPNYEKLRDYDMKTLSHMTADERQAVIEEVQEAMGNVAESWRVQKFQGKNIVAVMRDGKPVLYEIHDKFVLDALTSFSTKEMNVVIEVWKAMTNGFKVVTTGANPFFAIPNAVRDIQVGYISSKTTNDPIKYMGDFFAAVGDALVKNQTYKDFMSAGGGYESAIHGDARALREVEWDMLPHSTVARILHVPVKLAESASHIVDISETANRLAEYKRTLKKGGTVLEGMRNQQEITVNFSRHGKVSKQIDNLIPYFQATINSYYKLFDTVFGKQDTKHKRYAWAKLIGANVFIAALAMASRAIYSKITGEDQEEEYKRLSPYIKNAYWCFPAGDGKFVRVPKQKDFMLLSTALERLVEYTKMENPRAFYQFDDYLESVLALPNSLDDVTLFGTFLSLAKNETFTGSPIVPYAYQNLLPEEQYNENTSEIAKKIGSTLHVSPMQVQFILDDNLGFIAKFVSYASDAKEAFRDGGITAAAESSLDSLTSAFSADNTYSTGEIGYFYDTKNGYDTRSATYKVRGEGNGQTFYDTYGAYKYDKIADVYSKCNTMIKQDKDEDNARSTRRSLNAFIKAVNDTEVSDMDEQVSALAEATGYDVSDIAPYIVTPSSITQRYNKQSYYVELTVEDMMEYYADAQVMFELYYPGVLSATGDSKDKAELLASVKKEINSYMRETWFEKIMERDGMRQKED